MFGHEDTPRDKLLLLILENLIQLNTKVHIMSQALDNLTAAVQQESNVIDSAMALLVGLKSEVDQLIAAGNADPALQALADSIGAKSSALAAAVQANTPAAPASPAV